MWCSDLFNELLPHCSGCQSPFDMRCCSPQVLPCSHTLCLSCVTTDSKVRKSGKRRCPTCDKRYTSFHLNTALGETIDRIRVRREALESQSRRCDECDKRAYISWMRRCISCEIQLKEAHLTSVICMECCVDRHNGHVLRVVTADGYAMHKDEKIGHSISICGSTSSSTQYRSNVSAHSSINSPCMHSTTRLHSTSSASSGFSSTGVPCSPGGIEPIETRTGITQKVTSFLSRVTTRSPSLPHAHSPSRGKTHTIPPPFPLQSPHKRNSPTHQPPPPPTLNIPMAPSQSSLRGRGSISSFRPAMGTLSPYMTPNNRGMLSLKKSLDDLDDCLPKGDILREETSPFYEGHSMYGMSLLLGGSSTTASPSPPPSILPPSLNHSLTSSRPLSEVRMESKRASLPITNGEGEYHRLSPFPARRSPLLLSYRKQSIGSATGTMRAQSPLANLANMPRRDPRIRGGPAYLHDVMNDSYYENQQRLSYQSSGSSNNGGDRRMSMVERREDRDEEGSRMKITPSTATFFDKHSNNDKQLAVVSKVPTVVVDDVTAHYINVTRSCENLPSQFSSLYLNNNNNNNNNNEGNKEGARRAIRFPLKSRVINNLSDHCTSYEYIGSS